MYRFEAWMSLENDALSPYSHIAEEQDTSKVQDFSGNRLRGQWTTNIVIQGKRP